MYPMAAIVPWHTVPALCDAVESIEEFVAERDTIISCLRLYGSPSYHAAEFAAVMFYPALSSRQARQSLQSTITSTELLSLAKHPQSGQPGATAPPTSLLSPQQKKPAITDVVRGSKVAIAIGATPISIGRCVLLCNVLPCFVQLGSVWCRCGAVVQRVTVLCAVGQRVVSLSCSLQRVLPCVVQRVLPLSCNWATCVAVVVDWCTVVGAIGARVVRGRAEKGIDDCTPHCRL